MLLAVSHATPSETAEALPSVDETEPEMLVPAPACASSFAVTVTVVSAPPALAEAMYLKTNQYHIAQFAYLTKRMKEIKEGEGSLLDRKRALRQSRKFLEQFVG